MKKEVELGLEFIIDELTNSVKNLISGDSFKTEVSLITKTDLKAITKKNNWLFNWKYELKQPERNVYKLTIVGNYSII